VGCRLHHDVRAPTTAKKNKQEEEEKQQEGAEEENVRRLERAHAAARRASLARAAAGAGAAAEAAEALAARLVVKLGRRDRRQEAEGTRKREGRWQKGEMEGERARHERDVKRRGRAPREGTTRGREWKFGGGARGFAP
jgi:hypothetical protein